MYLVESRRRQAGARLSISGGAAWKPDVFTGSVGWPGVRLSLDDKGGNLLPNGRLLWKLASANTVANPTAPEVRFEWPQVLKVEKTTYGSRPAARFTLLLDRRQRRFTFWTLRKRRLDRILGFMETRGGEVAAVD